jgi:hypothetical protein
VSGIFFHLRGPGKANIDAFGSHVAIVEDEARRAELLEELE